MSTEAPLPAQGIISAALFSFGVLCVLSAALLVAAFVAAARATARRRRRQNADRHDVGPDRLLLLEELDAHLDQQFAALAGLYEQLGPPDLDAGCARMRAAIREEQQRGEAS